VWWGSVSKCREEIGVCRDLTYLSKDLEWAVETAVEFVRPEVSYYALSLLLEFQTIHSCGLSRCLGGVYCLGQPDDLLLF